MLAKNIYANTDDIPVIMEFLIRSIFDNKFWKIKGRLPSRIWGITIGSA